MREANGTSTMLRACLIASVNRFWCGVHTPEIRRGVILPRSEIKLMSILTSL